MALQPPVVHAPDIQNGVWINAASPPDWRATGASALLVSFSDFTCINCLRVLPYVRAWQRMYAPHLFCLTVHTPEFSFARDLSWVTQAAGRLGIRWPILVDNQQTHWTAWAVRAWPTLFLVDRAGFIRMTLAGDRGYPDFEAAMRSLLEQGRPGHELPEALGVVLAEDFPGAVCLPVTPELQADEVNRAIPTLRSGPREGNSPTDYQAPEEGYRFEGDWVRRDDGWQLAGDSGAIHLTYTAAEVHIVLAPPKDEPPGDSRRGDPTIKVQLDGNSLTTGRFGKDVFRTAAGTGLRLDVPRLYNLINSSSVEPHELGLSFSQPGSTFYAFSFGSCVMPPIPPTSI